MNRRYFLQITLKIGLLIVCLFFSVSKVSALAQNSLTQFAEFSGSYGAEVVDIASNDSTTYVAGTFAYATASSTGGGVPILRNNGNRAGNFPRVVGSVLTSIPDSQNGWYIGGAFTIKGTSINNLAHILSDGTIDTTWTPNPDQYVYSITLSTTSTMYVGGNFTSIGGQSRSGLAEISLATGLATNWNPNITLSGGSVYVNTIALSTSTIFVGGIFSNVGATSRTSLAEVSLASGLATNWNPNITGASSNVYALALSTSTIFVGGDFTKINGATTRNYIAELSIYSGTITSWNPNISSLYSQINTIVLSTSTMYIGGTFTAVNGTARNRLAELSLSGTGSATSWNPNINGVVDSILVGTSTLYASGNFSTVNGSVTRNNLAELSLFGTGPVTNWNPNIGGEINTLLLGPSSLYIGGSFTSVNGSTSRNSIAEISTSTGIATSWNPNIDYTVTSLAINKALIYAGGTFGTVGGISRSYLAEIERSTGLATSWNPTPSDLIEKILISSGKLFVVGKFLSIDSTPRGELAVFNTYVPSPVLSNFSISNISSDGATVSWTTDTFTSSYASLGTDTSYGSTTPEIHISPRVTTHTVNISGLSFCTTYHIQAVSTDIYGSSVNSSDSTFTTIGCPVPTVSTPIASNGPIVGTLGGGWKPPTLIVPTLPQEGTITPSVHTTAPSPSPTSSQSSPTSTSTPLTLTHNIQYRDSGTDVTALQTYLKNNKLFTGPITCLLYTSPSPRD